MSGQDNGRGRRKRRDQKWRGPVPQQRVYLIAISQGMECATFIIKLFCPRVGESVLPIPHLFTFPLYPMSQPPSPYTYYSPYTTTSSSIINSPYTQQHFTQTINQQPFPQPTPHQQPSAYFRPPPPARQVSYPPYTPSNLSHPSSPVATTTMGTPSIPAKRAAANDLPGPSRRVDRKQSVDSTIQDDSSGKKKRVSLSCAQCE